MKKNKTSFKSNRWKTYYITGDKEKNEKMVL